MKYLPILAALLSQSVSAQLYIEPSTLVTIQKDATITTELSVISASDILGDGILQLSGPNPSLDMHSHSLQNVLVQSPDGVRMVSPMRINERLSLLQGKIICNHQQLTLGPHAQITRAASTNNIITDAAGTVHQLISHFIEDRLIPLGTASGDAEIFITATTTGNEGYIDLSASDGTNFHVPQQTSGSLPQYWCVNAVGVKDGIRLTAPYTEAVPNDELQAMAWNGSNWSSANNHSNAQRKQLFFSIPATPQELTAWVPLSVSKKTSLYPNPCHDQTVLSYLADATEIIFTEILDDRGGVILRQKYPVIKGMNALRIDVTSLSANNYALRVTGHRRSFSTNFVKL